MGANVRCLRAVLFAAVVGLLPGCTLLDDGSPGRRSPPTSRGPKSPWSARSNRKRHERLRGLRRRQGAVLGERCATPGTWTSRTWSSSSTRWTAAARPRHVPRRRLQRDVHERRAPEDHGQLAGTSLSRGETGTSRSAPACGWGAVARTEYRTDFIVIAGGPVTRERPPRRGRRVSALLLCGVAACAGHLDHGRRTRTPTTGWRPPRCSRPAASRARSTAAPPTRS